MPKAGKHGGSKAFESQTRHGKRRYRGPAIWLSPSPSANRSRRKKAIDASRPQAMARGRRANNAVAGPKGPHMADWLGGASRQLDRGSSTPEALKGHCRPRTSPDLGLGVEPRRAATGRD